MSHVRRKQNQPGRLVDKKKSNKKLKTRLILIFIMIIMISSGVSIALLHAFKII